MHIFISHQVSKQILTGKPPDTNMVILVSIEKPGGRAKIANRGNPITLFPAGNKHVEKTQWQNCAEVVPIVCLFYLFAEVISRYLTNF